MKLIGAIILRREVKRNTFKEAVPITEALGLWDKDGYLEISGKDLVPKVEYPIIDLSPLKDRLDVNSVNINLIGLKELQNSDYLKYCKNLKSFRILENPIEEIDLTCLENCEKLEYIKIFYNNLKYLDLTPLKLCNELKELNLGFNLFESLDLTPIGNCTKLEKLDLKANCLNSLDLTPLNNCTSLQEIRIEGNYLKQIDLAPLKGLPNLQMINLAGNPLLNLDILPLLYCPELKEIDFLVFDYPRCYNQSMGREWFPIEALDIPPPPKVKRISMVKIKTFVDTSVNFDPNYYKLSQYHNGKMNVFQLKYATIVD